MVRIDQPDNIVYYAASHLAGGTVFTDVKEFDMLKPLIDLQHVTLERGFHPHLIDYFSPYKATANLVLPNDRIVKKRFNVVDTLDKVTDRLIFWSQTIYIGPVEKYEPKSKKLAHVVCPNYLEIAQWIKHANRLHLTDPIHKAIAYCLHKKNL